MEKIIRIRNRDILIALHPATVIHSDKYTETSGGWGNLPVTSTLYTDVVFRINANKEDWPHKIKNYDLPIYSDQQVRVICADNIIIGYIDDQTKKYYYTSSNLCKRLGLGMSYYLVWVTGIVGATVIGFIHPGEWTPALCLLPFVISWLFFWIQKEILNNQTTKAIDQFLQSD